MVSRFDLKEEDFAVCFAESYLTMCMRRKLDRCRASQGLIESKYVKHSVAPLVKVVFGLVDIHFRYISVPAHKINRRMPENNKRGVLAHEGISFGACLSYSFNLT